MTTTLDAAVLTLLDQVQDVPADRRDAWLSAQVVAPEVITRVRRLLEAEARVGDFLEQAAAPAAALDWPGVPGVGDRLGSYELLEPLAAGGMGLVYRARRADDVYQQTVAIKLVRPVHLAGDPASRRALLARFEAERRILARLDHPNVARILDGGSTASGIPYLVMEYVEGVSLTRHCREARLGVRERVNLFRKVCGAVEAAHRHLIVHRDLKPDNVLVGADGEPRLIDFGIARLLDDAVDGSPAPGTTQLSAMTPAYASPEQIRQRPLTTGSDVYSLGVMLYQLIVDERPYELAGLSPAEVERLVCEGESKPLRRALRESALAADERRRRLAATGPDLERIVAQALHKDPQRRYGSARELADDLGRWLDGRPVAAHPDSALYRARKFIRRHALGVGLAGVALAAIATAAGIAIERAAEARAAAADTERINAFLLDIFERSDPYASGTEPTLGEALASATTAIDARFSDQPAVAARLRFALADAMRKRGRVEAAGPQLERALAESEAGLGPDHPQTARAMAALANLRHHQGRPLEAETLYRDALARLTRGGDATLALRASVLNDFGVMYLTQENFTAAQPLMQQSLEAGDAAGAAVDAFARAQTLGNLAQVARGLGDLDRAEALYIEVQRAFETEYPEGGPMLAVVLNNRARLARQRGQMPQALELQREAVAMHRRSFRGDHAMVLVPMTNLARMNFDLGRFAESLEVARDAAAMADRMYRDPHHYHAMALAALADAQQAMGDPGTADATLGRAEAILARLDVPHAGANAHATRVRDAICRADAALAGCAGR